MKNYNILEASERYQVRSVYLMQIKELYPSIILEQMQGTLSSQRSFPICVHNSTLRTSRIDNHCQQIKAVFATHFL